MTHHCRTKKFLAAPKSPGLRSCKKTLYVVQNFYVDLMGYLGVLCQVFLWLTFENCENTLSIMWKYL